MPNGAKNWCFTLNNWTIPELDLLQALGTEDGNGCVYLVFGRESVESGTPHLQGYISMDQRRSLAYMRRLVSGRAHWEVAKGTPQEASDYCKKEQDFEEFGSKPKAKGSRSDLASMFDAIKSGKRKREILDEHFGAFSRAHRAANDAMLIYAKPRNWVMVVKVFWGDTGLGKTRKAVDECGEDIPYFHPGGGWFDGYDGQSNVIFDDFGGSEFKLTYLLKLLDRYAMRVPVKGGYVNWAPKTIYITANRAPKDWYSGATIEHQAALKRRITEIHHFADPFNLNRNALWD